MIRTFGDSATADVFVGAETRSARELPKPLWPIIRRKLDALNRAKTIGDLRAPPGNRLESLRGTRQGQYSIRVNDQFRITFQFDNGHAYDVTCEDYH